jgi:hypothetical protein
VRRAQDLRTSLPASAFRRRPIVGPFTILIALLGLAALQAKSHFERHPAPVILPSQIVPSAGSFQIRGSVSDLVARAAALRLSRMQTARLQRLSGEERADDAPVLNRLQEDRAQVDDFIQAAAARGGASMAELQRQGEPFAADSAELARIRLAYWSKALNELNPKQRDAAEKLAGSELGQAGSELRLKSAGRQ